MVSGRTGGAIDAVITWVDGTDPKHKASRLQRLGQSGHDLHPNGTNPHRWNSTDELSYCLISIATHAPWLRHIWLVTDDQRPDLSRVPADLQARLSIIDHKIIFKGYETVLPTYNSLSIESLLCRIPDLAESFLYFNDDVFLTAPLRPEDVFCNGVPVLRGKWVDFSALAANATARRDPALFNHFTQINAARLAGFDMAHMWASAHVVHPLRRPLMTELLDRFAAEFTANVAHPFRDISQFQPMSLHNHITIRRRAYATPARKDYLHLRAGTVTDITAKDLQTHMQRLTSGEAKIICVNDFPQLEACFPETRAWIERAVGA